MMLMVCIYMHALRVLNTYGVGFSVACSDAKAMREPQIAEQQYCSPAFLCMCKNLKIQSI